MTKKKVLAVLGSAAAGFQIGLDLWCLTGMDLLSILFVTNMITLFIFVALWGMATEKKKVRRRKAMVPYDLSQCDWPYMIELDDNGNKRRVIG